MNFNVFEHLDEAPTQLEMAQVAEQDLKEILNPNIDTSNIIREITVFDDGETEQCKSKEAVLLELHFNEYGFIQITVHRELDSNNEWVYSESPEKYSFEFVDGHYGDKITIPHDIKDYQAMAKALSDKYYF